MRLHIGDPNVTDDRDQGRWDADSARSAGRDIVIPSYFGSLGARVVSVTMSITHADPRRTHPVDARNMAPGKRMPA